MTLQYGKYQINQSSSNSLDSAEIPLKVIETSFQSSAKVSFLMPLVSITQLKGKLMKMYVIMYDIGMSATVESDWSYAFAMGTEMGVTTTQHTPLTKDRTKKITTITNLLPYCRYSSSIYDLWTSIDYLLYLSQKNFKWAKKGFWTFYMPTLFRQQWKPDHKNAQ